MRQNDVATSFGRNNDVIITSGVCWGASTTKWARHARSWRQTRWATCYIDNLSAKRDYYIIKLTSDSITACMKCYDAQNLQKERKEENFLALILPTEINWDLAMDK